VRLQVDLRSKVPAYLQIVEEVQRRVAAGELAPGDQLPTVRQLAADLRINFNTVARAYRMLDEAGLISTQQGRGTYVVERLPAGRSRRLRQSALETLARDFAAAAARLGFSPAEISQALARALGGEEPPEGRSHE